MGQLLFEKTIFGNVNAWSYVRTDGRTDERRPDIDTTLSGYLAEIRRDEKIVRIGYNAKCESYKISTEM